MKFWKIAPTAAVLALSTSANAAIITYGGYTHDTDTDIVTGNGLEWLQWDRTLGQSINSIQSQLSTLEGGGWSVASNVQMAQLFNAFDFGLTFDTDENTTQYVDTGFSAGDPGTEADEVFISMFGDTYTASGRSFCYHGDCVNTSVAYYGNDPDADAGINRALVRDDSIYPSGYESAGFVELRDDGLFKNNDINATAGVALVREFSPVPVPAAAWLFGSGLLGLIGVARRKVRA